MKIKELRNEIKETFQKDRTFKGYEIRKLIEELFNRVGVLENDKT